MSIPYFLQALVVGITVSTTVTFSTGPATQSASTLVANPNMVTADGTSMMPLLFTARDAYNNPASGVTLTFSASGGNTTFAATSGATDANGNFATTLTSTLAQSETVSVAFGGGLTLATSVQFVAGSPAAANSSFVVNPNSTIANNSNALVAVLTLRDGRGNPIAGISPTFGASDTNTTVTSNGNTNSSGIATASYRTSRASNQNALVTVGALNFYVPIYFVPGPVSATTSTLTASPNALTADGTAVSALSATVRDVYSNLIPGAVVAFGVGGGNNTLSASSATANASGVATTSLKSTRAETKTATATAGGAAFDTNIVFYAGAPAEATTTFVINPNANVVADAVGTANFNLKVYDAYGNAAGGQNVTVTATGTSNTFALPAGGQTDANGLFAGTLVSTKAELKTVTAGVGGLSLAANVKFVAGPASSTYTSVSASPNASIYASGQTRASLFIYVADVYNNAIGGVNASLSASGGNALVSPDSITTATNGSATASLSATTAGTKTVTLASGSAVASTSASFIPGVYAPSSTLMASPSSALADSNSTILLTLNANDSSGASFANGLVTWRSSVNGAIFSPATSRTSASGIATTSLVAPYAGNQNVTAVVAGATITIPVAFNSRSAPCASPNMTFRPSYPWPDLGNPYGYSAIALGDMNKDANQDVAVIDVGGYMRVYLGRGNGTFAAATRTNVSTAGTNASSLIIGDFDADGFADAAAGAGGNIRIFYGNSGGYFSFVALSGNASSFVSNLQIADLNKDGISDLVAVDPNNSSVMVFLSIGTRTYAAPALYGVGANPQQSALADFNQDANVDIAVSNFGSNTVSLLLGLGGGRFGTQTSFSTASGPIGIVAAKVNADAYPDLIVAANSNKTLALMLNSSGSSFPSVTAIGPSGHTYGKVLYTDIDNDTYGDLITGVNNAVAIIYGASGGTFATTATFVSSPSGQTIPATGDVNNDGLTDIVSAGIIRAAGVNLNPNSRTWTRPASYTLTGAAGSRTTVADLNLDGFLDILTGTTYGGGGINIALGRGDGTFTTGLAYGFNYPARIKVGDVDGDGFPDVGFAGNSAVNVMINSGNANGALRAVTVYPVSASATDLVAEDFNNDGRLDFAVASNSNAMGILLNQNSTPLFSTTMYATAALTSLIALDYDADGFLDIVATGFNGPIYVFRNKGDGTFVSAATISVSQAFQMAPVDFNQDGLEDFVLLGGYATSVKPYLNQGGGSFALQPAVQINQAYQDIAIGDVNNDSFSDIIVGGQNSSIAILHGSSSGAFYPPVTYPASTFSATVAVGDFNRDGVLDIVNGGQNLTGGAALSILLSNGCGQ